MGQFGGFYKGDKKKPKKDKDKKIGASYNAPVFTMPEIVSKKKEKGS
jgi:hypothetical protein